MSKISERALASALEQFSRAADTVDQLTAFVREFVSPYFDVRSSAILGLDGQQTESFPIVIFIAAGTEVVEGDPIPVDRVAAVVETVDDLDIQGLHRACEKIAKLKTTAKTPVPKGEVRTNITYGVVFAKRSAVSLETLSDEIYRINEATPHRQWLDLLVLSEVGVMNYAVQFPGENVSGDFMPPAEGALLTSPPAIYVVIVMRPLVKHTCNKFISLLIAHLQLYAPDVREQLPNFTELLDGVPTVAITNLGFQPNLKGELVPAAAEDYRGRNVPQSPIAIVDPKGNTLGHIEFRRWQDGGIILLAGKLPLEGLLVFLPNARPEYLRVIRREEIQVSYVLPIARPHFQELLENIQRRSNMRINMQPPGFVIQKLMDEGTSTPFIARCTLGILRVRENVFSDVAKRDAFDKVFQSSLSSLTKARDASGQYHKVLADHVARVESGEIGKINGGNIQILENADGKLSTEFETFLNAASRAIKTGLQALATHLGNDIGFLFKKPSAFDTGIAKLQGKDPTLAAYLSECRLWTEKLILSRNNLEHDIWEFPKLKYRVENGYINVSEPEIEGESAGAKMKFFLDRVQCMFEELIVHMLRSKFPAGVELSEIAPTARTVESPERFRITLAVGGETPWSLQYHAELFENV